LDTTFLECGLENSSNFISSISRQEFHLSISSKQKISNSLMAGFGSVSLALFLPGYVPDWPSNPILYIGCPQLIQFWPLKLHRGRDEWGVFFPPISGPLANFKLPVYTYTVTVLRPFEMVELAVATLFRRSLYCWLFLTHLFMHWQTGQSKVKTSRFYGTFFCPSSSWFYFQPIVEMKPPSVLFFLIAGNLLF